MGFCVNEVSVYHGCNKDKCQTAGLQNYVEMLIMSAPLRIAAGASTLGAVFVVGILSVGTQSTQIIEPTVSAVSTVGVEQVSDPKSLVPDNVAGPTFDLVRVDDTGSAVIAGSAEPLTDVAIVLSGDQIETVQTDNNGAFVALFQLPQAEAALTVGLQQLRGGSVVAVSVQTVLVVPPLPDANEGTAPTIVLADGAGAEVLQGGARSAPELPTATNPLSLDTISYDNSGAVVLSGQGTGAQFVRIYVDNEPIETELVPNDGNWRVVLPEIAQGQYTLRVDEINDVGSVQARVESPFQRAAPQDLLADGATSTDTGRVVVQPGHTLWELAQDTYGDGVKYVQIFHANRDTIRDANLIYPGQIFKLPE